MGTNRTEHITTVEPPQAQSSGTRPSVSLHPTLHVLQSWSSWYVGSQSRGGTRSLHLRRTRDGFDLMQRVVRLGRSLSHLTTDWSLECI
jgi:hypothetical protein